jgi:hypothetical protein
MDARYRDFCCPLFRKVNILPLFSQYIILLSTFAVKKNTDALKSNSAICSINTRQGFHLQQPTINLSKAQKRYIAVELKSLLIYQ